MEIPVRIGGIGHTGGVERDDTAFDDNGVFVDHCTREVDILSGKRCCTEQRGCDELHYGSCEHGVVPPGVVHGCPQQQAPWREPLGSFLSLYYI